MLRHICQLLPVFLYKRLARRHCEVVVIGGTRFVTAAPDVLVAYD